MIKALRNLADWLEVKSCRAGQKWNKFLDKRKVKVHLKVHYCKECICEK